MRGFGVFTAGPSFAAVNRILLKGGSIVDGTGKPRFTGDVLVEGDRIAALGQAPDARVVDCSGLTICPGFIDGHSHSDVRTLDGAEEKSRQGVTTEITGNCGFSAFPACGDRAALHAFANGILSGRGDWGWRRASEYLAAARSSGTAVQSLVGHGTLRIAVAGNRLGALTASEMEAAEQLLDEALADGACGFSTGLMYAPGSSAPREELERLCSIVARRGKIYTTHMRDYSGALVAAVDEQIDLARRSGCRLQISHFQAVGQKHWPEQRPALDRIEQARAEGVDVAFDCYPYVAGSTVVTLFLPQVALDGGNDAMLRRISAEPDRSRIAAECERMLAQTWEDIFVSAAGTPAGAALVGRSIADIAQERGSTPALTVLDLLLENEGQVNVLEFNQSEENLRQTLTHPLSTVISDGFYVSGRPHPRLAGTFPTLLGEMSRRRGWLTLEEAVRKITSAPAERFNLADRGRLAPGMRADLVVFDANRVDSPATYDDPERSPVGIEWIMRGGRLSAFGGADRY